MRDIDTTAALLAEKLAREICGNGECPPEWIPAITLAVIARVPALQSATEAQAQYIFNTLCSALADRQTARTTSKDTRWLA
jgi:hypothetical protein